MDYSDIKNFRTQVPEGKIGLWSIRRFTVSEKNASVERIRSVYSFSSRGRCVPAGTYTRLLRDKVVVMSDTPDELSDCLSAWYHAEGFCLINGLGLGLITELCLMKSEVEKITVIEIDSDVIKLVGEHLFSKYGMKRLEIINTDALQYKSPPKFKYNMVWHDIWDNICADNLNDMKKLHRKYGQKTKWQGSWCRDWIR